MREKYRSWIFINTHIRACIFIVFIHDRYTLEVVGRPSNGHVERAAARIAICVTRLNWDLSTFVRTDAK